MSSESEAVMKSALEYHAKVVGVEPETLIAYARRDGIIIGIEPVKKAGRVFHRYQLVGSLAEFRVYAERLGPRLRE